MEHFGAFSSIIGDKKKKKRKSVKKLKTLMPDICVSEMGQRCSGNGLSPVRRQAMTWINADLLSIAPLGTKFSKIQTEIQNFSVIKMQLKMASAKWQPFRSGRDELIFCLYSSLIVISLELTIHRYIFATDNVGHSSQGFT